MVGGFRILPDLHPHTDWEVAGQREIHLRKVVRQRRGFRKYGEGGRDEEGKNERKEK